MKKLHHIQTVSLSSTVLAVFKNQLSGQSISTHSDVSDADLAKLNHNLVLSLMPFQKEGVKYAV